MATNKYSLYAKVAGRWMHVLSHPTKAEAEKNRRFYRRRHQKPTRIVPIGTKPKD